MRWLERLGFFVAGGVISAATLLALGKIELADDFLSSTLELYPSDACRAMRTMRRAYGNPPFSPGEFIFDLQAKGLPKLVSMLKESINLL